MVFSKCNQELSRSVFYRHKNFAVCPGDEENRCVPTVQTTHSEAQCSSAYSGEHTIGSKGCDISDEGESGQESGPESTGASNKSNLDEIE